MVPVLSFPCSQRSIYGPYLERSESSPYPAILFRYISQMLSFHMHLAHSTVLFLSGITTKFLIQSSSVPFMLRVLSIAFWDHTKNIWRLGKPDQKEKSTRVLGTCLIYYIRKANITNLS
jgi:hypothetical protein